mmetsp:Transcript_71512/g.172629  ORF Transcript_71512/g.172629 Transcript_71512/m.172629 type:complete len:224 (+) Transcript_71512:1057-1728(+)
MLPAVNICARAPGLRPSVGLPASSSHPTFSMNALRKRDIGLNEPSVWPTAVHCVTNSDLSAYELPEEAVCELPEEVGSDVLSTCPMCTKVLTETAMESDVLSRGSTSSYLAVAQQTRSTSRCVSSAPRSARSTMRHVPAPVRLPTVPTSICVLAALFTRYCTTSPACITPYVTKLFSVGGFFTFRGAGTDTSPPNDREAGSVTSPPNDRKAGAGSDTSPSAEQ